MELGSQIPYQSRLLVGIALGTRVDDEAVVDLFIRMLPDYLSSKIDLYASPISFEFWHQHCEGFFAGGYREFLYIIQPLRVNSESSTPYAFGYCPFEISLIREHVNSNYLLHFDD